MSRRDAKPGNMSPEHARGRRRAVLSASTDRQLRRYAALLRRVLACAHGSRR